MSIVGHQEFWLAGSRMYFKRDAVASVAQPLVDLGVIKPANPAITPTLVQLKDSDGGVNTTVDEGLTSIDETYDITCNNMNLQNFSILFLSTPAANFAQTAGSPETITHSVIANHLFKIIDDDLDLTPLYNVNIRGIVQGAITGADTFTAFDTSTGIITTTADHSGGGLADIAVNDYIILQYQGGLLEANAGSFKVTAVGTNSLTVEVPSTIGAAQATLTGQSLVYAKIADAGSVLIPNTDYVVVSAERGIVQCVEGGAITTGDVDVYMDRNALSGDRLLAPQAGSSSIKGQMYLVWSRDNNDKQTVREARVSVTPSSSNIQIDDYSEMVFTVTVLSDVNTSGSAGRMLQFAGALPSAS